MTARKRRPSSRIMIDPGTVSDQVVAAGRPQTMDDALKSLCTDVRRRAGGPGKQHTWIPCSGSGAAVSASRFERLSEIARPALRRAPFLTISPRRVQPVDAAEPRATAGIGRVRIKEVRGPRALSRRSGEFCDRWHQL